MSELAGAYFPMRDVKGNVEQVHRRGLPRIIEEHCEWWLTGAHNQWRQPGSVKGFHERNVMYLEALESTKIININTVIVSIILINVNRLYLLIKS